MCQPWQCVFYIAFFLLLCPFLPCVGASSLPWSAQWDSLLDVLFEPSVWLITRVYCSTSSTLYNPGACLINQLYVDFARGKGPPLQLERVERATKTSSPAQNVGSRREVSSFSRFYRCCVGATPPSAEFSLASTKFNSYFQNQMAVDQREVCPNIC